MENLKLAEHVDIKVFQNPANISKNNDKNIHGNLKYCIVGNSAKIDKAFIKNIFFLGFHTFFQMIHYENAFGKCFRVKTEIVFFKF